MTALLVLIAITAAFLVLCWIADMAADWFADND